jgi:serine protease AprX
VLALVLVLVTPVVAAYGMTAVAPPAVHPSLLALAQTAPERPASVIIQAPRAVERLEAAVERLGGTVTNRLPIIGALAASAPARVIPALAGEAGVRWISPDGPIVSAAGSVTINGRAAANTYLDTIRARQVWAMGHKGQGIGVAIIDSGVSTSDDFKADATWDATDGDPAGSRLRVSKNFRSVVPRANDLYGHGTHVAGIIGGNGNNSDGAILGVAPRANLYNLRVSDDSGYATESAVVNALQWVKDNKAKHNIRVVNLSLNSTVEQSYHLSPMNAAAEILWFSGVVVVVAAGNSGGTALNTVNTAPANDPFVITVGASDERGTASPTDDVMAAFSARGTTRDGHLKPEIVAPGKGIISVLANTSDWGRQYPTRVASGGDYIQLSGTSMAAPMVAGAAALLLQDEPHLTPDQVKHRLMTTGRALTTGGVTYRSLDAYAAVTGTSTASANTGRQMSTLLTTGSSPVTGSVNWNSVNWNSVNWNSVNWNSVNWNSVSWRD